MTAPLLLAVGHGSRDPRSEPVQVQLLDIVRQLRPGAPVRGAYLDFTAPALPDALEQAAVEGVTRAVVVPLLITEAYHTRTDIPRLLAPVRSAGRISVTQAAALGPHPLLVTVAEERLREAGVVAGDPGTALVLGAAGSSNPEAIATVRAIARTWAARGWWAVEPAYASAAPPTVAQAVAALRQRGAPRVAVSSYVLAPGTLPDRLLTGSADVVAAPLGACEEMARLVLARYDEVLDRAVEPPLLRRAR